MNKKQAKKQLHKTEQDYINTLTTRLDTQAAMVKIAKNCLEASDYSSANNLRAFFRLVYNKMITFRVFETDRLKYKQLYNKVDAHISMLKLAVASSKQGGDNEPSIQTQGTALQTQTVTTQPIQTKHIFKECHDLDTKWHRVNLLEK